MMKMDGKWKTEGDFRQDDIDVVFILTQDSYYVARYDNATDKITQYQRVLLVDVDQIEFGVQQEQQNNFNPFNFGAGRYQNSRLSEHTMRISYKLRTENEDVDADVETGYFHMFRSAQLRFFNNMAIVTKNAEEKVESLKSIADSVAVAMELAGLTPELWMGKIEKRKSKVIETNEEHGQGETSAFKSVGSRAFFSMTNQFSRLNPMSKLKLTPKREENAEEIIEPGEPRPDNFTPEKSGPSAISNLLSPIGRPLSPNLNFQTRKLFQRSNEDLAAESSDNPPAVLSARETVLAPFAKITKGIQSLATVGGAEGGTTPSSSQATNEEQTEDYMKTRLKSCDTKTKVILV